MRHEGVITSDLLLLLERFDLRGDDDEVEHEERCANDDDDGWRRR